MLVCMGSCAIKSTAGSARPVLSGSREVFADSLCIWVVGAEDTFTVSEGALVQPDRLAKPSRRFIGAGEVVA